MANTMDDLRTTNRLLLIIVVPLVFYLLQLLKFIFLPLISAMFITILFLPLMRWFKKKKIPRFFSVLLVLCVMIFALKVGTELIQLASKDVQNADIGLIEQINQKVNFLFAPVTELLGRDISGTDNTLSTYINLEDLTQPIGQYFGTAIQMVRNTTSMVLMTLFFLVLLLAGSVDLEKIMQQTLFRKKKLSVKTFSKVESSFIKFIKVKFVISLATGICFGLACLAFGVSFPLLWALVAFILNFVQVVGSIVSTLILALFAFAEMDPSGTLLFFVICIAGVQVIFGSILEPIFMGQSFKINIITILVMLMLWGFIWGVTGIILAVPLTVLIKTILEEFPGGKRLAAIMS